MRSAAPVGTSALVLCLAGLAPSPISAQDPEGFLLTGTVVDARSDRPVQGVRVTMAGSGLVLVSDVEGRFTLPPLLEGRYAMRLERIGYETVDGDLDVFQDGDFTIEMEPTSDYQSGGRLQGVVLDAETGEPVPAVRVRLGGQGPAADTDEGGRFAFHGLDPGTYRVRTQALGYAERSDDVEVRAGRIAHAEILLSPDPLEVESLEVVVEERWLSLDLAGFYERRDQGLGIFLDRGEILGRSRRQISEAFEGMAGVQVVDIGRVVHGIVFQEGRRAGRRISEWCGPDLWIDGHRALRPEGGPTQLDRFVSPEDVAGIEIYRRPAELPLQYGGWQYGCGVIVIWTR